MTRPLIANWTCFGLIFDCHTLGVEAASECTHLLLRAEKALSGLQVIACPRFRVLIMLPVVLSPSLRANTRVLRRTLKHVIKRVFLFRQSDIVLFDVMTPKVSAEWLGRVDLDNLPDQFPSLIKATGGSCKLEVINIYDDPDDGKWMSIFQATLLQSLAC